MIKLYEIALLNYMQLAIPSLKQSVYAESEDLFEAYNERKLSPSFYYNRTAEQNILSKSIYVDSDETRSTGDIQSGVKSSTTFYIVPHNYKGYIAVEKQKDLIDIMSQLRFYIMKNPYLYVQWLAEPYKPIPVGLRLLYIKLEEIRNNKQDKGPLRVVEFSWDSQLFISQEEKVKLFDRINVNVNLEINKEFDKN